LDQLRTYPHTDEKEEFYSISTFGQKISIRCARRHYRMTQGIFGTVANPIE